MLIGDMKILEKMRYKNSRKNETVLREYSYKITTKDLKKFRNRENIIIRTVIHYICIANYLL